MMPADPLEILRQPAAPIAPRAAFTADLRRRLQVALDLNPGGVPMSTPSTIDATAPDHAAAAAAQPAVSVYLCATGASAAIDFYREAFAAVETLRMTADDGRIGHAELTIGGTTVMLSDEYPELGVVSPQTLGGTSIALYLRIDDVDATYAQAVAAGATGERPPADQFHGNRTATLRDPFGHRWMLSKPVEEVSVEEMARRAPDYTVEGGDSAPSVALERPVGQLGYFTLSAPDVVQAATFYGALFGWRFEAPGPGSGGHTYSHVDNTDVPFGFHSDVGDQSPHHYYRVADLGVMVARVRELGGEVLDVTEHPSGGNARCRDDQGVVFDLWQPAPGY
jgi:uncharacterized glyoxalase superfamily protein PhnB